MNEKGRSRILVVLFVVFALFIIFVIGFWMLSGGATSVVRTITGFGGNPVDIIFHESTTTYSIRLPWQPEDVTRGPDITPLAEEADRINGETYDEQASDTQSQRGQLDAAARVKTFASPSQYRGSIALEDGDAASADPLREFVRISSTAEQAIDLSGWSLQSALTGVRYYIPGAAIVLTPGVVNQPSPVLLEPGGSAVVTTGPSPAGISFKETKCTGFLSQLQEFSPALMNSCPNPSSFASAAGSAKLEQACLDFIDDIPRCHMPTSAPSSLSATCRNFLGSSLTYAGCLKAFQSNADFALPSWRLYLGLATGIWDDTHDTIRLHDAQGRIVDTITY